MQNQYIQTFVIYALILGFLNSAKLGMNNVSFVIGSIFGIFLFLYAVYILTRWNTTNNERENIKRYKRGFIVSTIVFIFMLIQIQIK